MELGTGSGLELGTGRDADLGTGGDDDGCTTVTCAGAETATTGPVDMEHPVAPMVMAKASPAPITIITGRS